MRAVVTKVRSHKAMQKQDHIRKVFSVSDTQNISDNILMPIAVTLLTQLVCYVDFTVFLSSIFTPLMLFLNIFSLLKMLNLAFFPTV